ncbi:hypothetical protein AB1N83_004798 [Pleurotus pulmonarius]
MVPDQSKHMPQTLDGVAGLLRFNNSDPYQSEKGGCSSTPLSIKSLTPPRSQHSINSLTIRVLQFDPESFGARQTRNEESTGPWKLEQDVTPHDAYMLCSTVRQVMRWQLRRNRCVYKPTFHASNANADANVEALARDSDLVAFTPRITVPGGPTDGSATDPALVVAAHRGAFALWSMVAVDAARLVKYALVNAPSASLSIFVFDSISFYPLLCCILLCVVLPLRPHF